MKFMPLYKALTIEETHLMPGTEWMGWAKLTGYRTTKDIPMPAKWNFEFSAPSDRDPGDEQP